MKPLPIVLFLLLFTLLSCRKDTQFVTLALGVEGVEMVQSQGDFNLSKGSLSDHCTRISCALFQEDKRVKLITQEASDPTFGRLTMRVPVGKYLVVVIAHSGAQNCSVTTPDKITFNGKCTDTFFMLDSLDLAVDTSCPIVLSRAVAMYRLRTSDPVPPEVKQLKFYYTGGSSTFSAVSGYGCVNSRQTEYREILPERVGEEGLFEIYTFPHQELDTLKISISALDASGNPLYQTDLTQIPVRRNWITQQTMPLFTQQNHDNTLNVDLADSGRWSGIITI